MPKPTSQKWQFLFHATIDPAAQACIGETLNLGDHLLYRKNITAHSGIDVIFDGKMYKEMFDRTNLKQDYSFSLTMNSDGVPIFKSSSFSIWPILSFINELPLHERKKHTCGSGLWFGYKKPNMSAFFKPFSKEI